MAGYLQIFRNSQSSKELYQRVKSNVLLPPRWSMEMDVDQLLVSQFPLSSSSSTVVNISGGLSWTISIHGIPVCVPDGVFPQVGPLNSVDRFLGLLKNLGSCQICQGNPDEKFHLLRDRLQGKYYKIVCINTVMLLTL